GRATEADWLRNKEIKQRTSGAASQGNSYQNQVNWNKGNSNDRSDRNNLSGWKRQRFEELDKDTVNAAPRLFYCYNFWDAGHKIHECTNPQRQRPKNFGGNQHSEVC
ncbi:hypothetical protein MKW92_000243, partial [Papaver armeniacum]